jgi:diguanylate cyclase (GGDEF)-like protein
VGDLVLRAIADVITRTGAAHGAASFGARLGGEEFLLVLPGAGAEEAFGCAEKLRLGISGHDWGSVREGLAVTASLGLATAPDGRADHRDLLRLADANLYAAKDGGRNQTVAGETPDAASAPAP